jgi:hypothetical protein
LSADLKLRNKRDCTGCFDFARLSLLPGCSLAALKFMARLAVLIVIREGPEPTSSCHEGLPEEQPIIPAPTDYKSPSSSFTSEERIVLSRGVLLQAFVSECALLQCLPEDVGRLIVLLVLVNQSGTQ